MSALLDRPTASQRALPPQKGTRMSARRRGRCGFAAAAVLAGTLALVGCSSSDGNDGSSGDAAESQDLNGRSFISTEVKGRTLVTGTAVSLTFEDDHISAEAGCNTIFGGVTWDGGVLTTTGPLAMSKKGCERGLAAQDEWLSAFLASEPAIVLEGETLVLGDDRQGITLPEGEG